MPGEFLISGRYFPLQKAVGTQAFRKRELQGGQDTLLLGIRSGHAPQRQLSSHISQIRVVATRKVTKANRPSPKMMKKRNTNAASTPRTPSDASKVL